ncbi:MAG TPA: DUF3147 family protein [Verrucomicrobiae bacterium]|nr:DUF3147 family protein [Verrucomicrobiae bacterium]
MFVQFHFDAVKKVKWNQLAIRFFFGGVITAAAGLVARYWGPLAGGLFLAFPAIFPASVTLLAKKQAQQKAAHGMPGATRGRKAAAIENRGTILGCVGLASFGLAVWLLPPSLHAVFALLLALGVWSAVSLALWSLVRKIKHA